MPVHRIPHSFGDAAADALPYNEALARSPRKQVVFERLLARLLVAAPNRWVLKGCFALDLRLGVRARSARDIDLARRDDVEHATDDLLAAQATELDDYFVFAVKRTNDLDPALEGAAVRYRVTTSPRWSSL